MPTALNSVPYILAGLTILLALFQLVKEWNEYDERKWLRKSVLVVLIVVAGLTFISLHLDEKAKEKEQLKSEGDIRDLKGEVKAAHADQTDNTRVFLDRLGVMSTELSNEKLARTQADLLRARREAKDVKRITTPLGPMSITLEVQVDKERQASGPFKNLREYLVSRKGADKYSQDRQDMVTINHQDLPPDLRDAMTTLHEIEDASVNLYHETSCAVRSIVPSDMALIPWHGMQQPRAAYWTYHPDNGDLTYTRTLTLGIFTRTPEIVSVEDIFESTIRITFSSFQQDDEFPLVRFIFNAAEGTQFWVTSDKFDKTRTYYHGYCYMFKQRKK